MRQRRRPAPQHFYPRSPCGERPDLEHCKRQDHSISIHALLAESDPLRRRSTRRIVISIHALLAESDRHRRGSWRTDRDFYPRSPCGERQIDIDNIYRNELFLSTLSLRRATKRPRIFSTTCTNFYPRSPCGERRLYIRQHTDGRRISIHALLAESDLQRLPGEL